MSEENVEVVRRIIDAIGDRDLGQLHELTDPQVEWRSFFALGEGGEHDGHVGLQQYVRDLDESWEKFRPEIDALLGVGDVVMGVGRIHYRGRGSRVEADSHAGWLFKLHDGKVVRFRALREPEAAIESLWLSE